MAEEQQPFIGSEALASGSLSRHELRRYYRAIMPNVYFDKRVEPSLRQRTLAAHLWSRREAVVSGLAASAMHGAKWIDHGSSVELIWHNARSPSGVVTRDQLLLENEIQLTTPERTAFDLGRGAVSVPPSRGSTLFPQLRASKRLTSHTWLVTIVVPVVCVNSRSRWTSWMRAHSRQRKRGCGS